MKFNYRNYRNYRLATMLVGLVLFASGNVVAQGSVDDQAAVWEAVETIWAADKSGDKKWIENMLSADFMGWQNDSPAPRSKSSVRMWINFDRAQANGMAHELYPLSIVVHGDMAIVHYLYTNAVQTRDKKTSVTSGRYTAVLVRDDGTWKFISWHGGDDD